MKKKYWIILLVIIIAIVIIFFSKNTAKVFKNGNNKNSQEIVDYILNISSYSVNITVEVSSNKNHNKYILKQKYVSPNISTQEVIEPSNIAGIKITNDGTNLKLENSNLNLSTVFENYNYLGDNCLDLISFIENYKQNTESTFIEEENQIIMKTKSGNENRYTKNKTLYIDKKSCKPSKLEIKDNNEKTTVYILYNEVEINSTNKEDIVAFEINNIQTSV
jgi:outer membrane lipoprotein-sorting protein